MNDMKLLKVTRTDTEVRFAHEVKTETGVETRDHTAHEAPLKKFDDALADLAAVAAKMLELPADYADGISVHTLSLTYTKQGTRSAQILFTKGLDATSTQHPLKTPFFQIEDGKKDEGTKRQCPPGAAKAVENMIDRAVEYAKGKRQQMQLGLGDKKESASVPDNVEHLPGMAGTGTGED